MVGYLAACACLACRALADPFRGAGLLLAHATFDFGVRRKRRDFLGQGISVEFVRAVEIFRAILADGEALQQHEHAYAVIRLWA